MWKTKNPKTDVRSFDHVHNAAKKKKKPKKKKHLRAVRMFGGKDGRGRAGGVFCRAATWESGGKVQKRKKLNDEHKEKKKGKNARAICTNVKFLKNSRASSRTIPKKAKTSRN